MIKFILGVSLTLNLVFIIISYLIYKKINNPIKKSKYETNTILNNMYDILGAINNDNK